MSIFVLEIKFNILKIDRSLWIINKLKEQRKKKVEDKFKLQNLNILI